MKCWTHWPGEDCPKCGSVVEAFTLEEFEPGVGFDGDQVRCVECGLKGMVSVVETEAFVAWDEPIVVHPHTFPTISLPDET